MNAERRLRMLRNGVSIAAIGAALAACSGGGHVTMTPPPPPAPQEDFFGTAFGVDFRANPNTEPVVPGANDVIAVSLTTEPQAVTFPSG